MSQSLSFSLLLPMGLNLTNNELLVLLCFDPSSGRLCFPDCGLSITDSSKTLRILISKQLIVKRQYYNLTKKGLSIRCKFNKESISNL